jgi:hypothetical protein
VEPVQWLSGDGPPDGDPALAAVKTWRYLRLAMVAMVVGLAVSVLYEHALAPGGCWQKSISAYYYTPVQNFFVAALVTIGICLVVLKGSTEREDLLLNLAGMCAPVVGLVPTPDFDQCGSVVTDTTNRAVNIANNVTALLVAGGLALLLLAVLALPSLRHGTHRPSRTALAGFAIATGLYLGTVVVFAFARPWFDAHAHDVAAVAMFSFVFLNVCLNAVDLHGTGAPRLNRYAVVAALMVVAVLVSIGLALDGNPHALLVLEASLIVLFAVFWVCQTAELWAQGLRSTAPPGERDELAPSTVA